ncbi:kelch-like protein 9 [Tubulanus polymorphus]|uniref:kelch-like protein 9 n=1 Tax=Tubulanus polymorphus TaxID=672921 RepID=UPI003DA388D8
MSQESKRPRRDSAMTDGETSQNLPPPPEGNKDHGMRMLQGLNSLRNDKTLCDVTLIAEGQRFDVHKVILVSCSDYFRSMFTSGMKESHQREVELKGVTAKGLEKVLEVIYASTTILETDDIFDVIAAATHLQVTSVIEFCERNFLSGITTLDFYDFINTAKLYNMHSALLQIDNFITTNLLQIARDGNLNYLTYEQMFKCVKSNRSQIHEIDLFKVGWEWIRLDPSRRTYAIPLMNEIRFILMEPADIVNHVQKEEAMMTDRDLVQMVIDALNYHVVPHSQPLKTGLDMGMRSFVTRVVSVGGRQIQPVPGLSSDVHIFDEHITSDSLVHRRWFDSMPSPLSHCQVVTFHNFLYVLGGCCTQCAHGESAVNSVHRFDVRFETWYQCNSMLYKRAYFFAGVLGNLLIAVGGKQKDGSLASTEIYDPADNAWETVSSLPAVRHAHSGVIHNNYVYITGGYSHNNFTSEMLRFDPATNMWDEMEPMHTARGWHVMCQTNNKFYVFGGCCLNANHQCLPVMVSESYDPEVGQWTIIAPLSLSHKEASCVVYNDSIYVVGGYNVQTKTGQKMVSRFDLQSGTWEAIGELPQSMTGVGYAVLKFSETHNQDII